MQKVAPRVKKCRVSPSGMQSKIQQAKTLKKEIKKLETKKQMLLLAKANKGVFADESKCKVKARAISISSAVSSNEPPELDSEAGEGGGGKAAR